VLEVIGLRFAYPNGTDILHDINLSVARGSKLAIVGCNGSGKTTLARLMCGLLGPTGGSVVADGCDTARRDTVFEVRRRVGLVFQDPDDQMVEATVAREVAFGLRNLGLEIEEIKVRAGKAMAVFGIEHLKDRPCHLLSAGEKQLVAVASIFAMEPAYVILDESTSLLDSVSRGRLLDAVEELLRRTEAGLVFITMRLEDAWLCDEVLHLEGGEVGFHGSKYDYLDYLGKHDFPLYGLPLLVSKIGGVLPAFARRVSGCDRLDPDCVADSLIGTGASGGEKSCP
jgi:energy-coupling factor transport system ATP-binding protein